MSDATKPSESKKATRISINEKTTMPMTQLRLSEESQQKDARTKKGEDFYKEVASGIVKIYKTTRAGATVDLCSESVKRKELFTLICRTNKNITSAVKGDTAKVIGHPINIVHITRNSYCPRIIELTEKYPSIRKIGLIPLPNCDQCEVNGCPIRAAFETPLDALNGFSLTYAKLQSLMTSENKKVKALLEKIGRSRNIILDEVHFLQEAGNISVTIWEKREGREYSLNPKAFCKLGDSSPLIRNFLDKLDVILNGVKSKVDELRQKSEENHYLKHLALLVPNPDHAEALEKQQEYYRTIKSERERLRRLYPEKDLIEIAELTPDHSKEYGDLLKDNFSFNQIVKIQELLINAIKDPQKYDLTDEQIVILTKLLTISNADTLVIAYVKGAESEQISIQAQDTIFYDSIRKFLSKTLAHKENKRFIFTSATFGSINLEKLLQIKNVKNYVWGDPLNTSDKFLVIADKSKVSSFNFGRKAKSIIAFIDGVIAKYGAENVAICAMNKKWAKIIGHDCTWYGSDTTEGVASSKRIWIFIGLAEKPVNAKDTSAIVQEPYHDVASDLNEEDRLYCISQKLRTESVHMTTYQAISRAKDPNAKNRSLAIMIGARKEDVEKCLLWGTTRTLNAVKTDNGVRFDVDVKDPIGKPHLTTAPLSSNIEESMHVVSRWLNDGAIEQTLLNWPHIQKLVDSRGSLSAKRLTNVYGYDAQDVKYFFDQLPEYFTKESIQNYLLIRDSNGTVKGIAASKYKEGLTESSIIYGSGSGQSSVVLNDWWGKLKSAVDRAPLEFNKLSSSYFSDHVSASTYAHLGEFHDALTSAPALGPGWIVVGENNEARDNRKLIRDVHCLGCWSPDYPRRFGSPLQVWVNNTSEILECIEDCLNTGRDAFVSAYAFPEQKHPMSGGTPPVSTLFIDIDVENDEFSELKSRWEKGDPTVIEKIKMLRLLLMEDVLYQAKSVAKYLKAHSIEPRILLSGFKGVHLFVDFPTVKFGSLEAAKRLLRKLTEDIETRTFQETEVKVAFDPTVMGDLSRLCRIPNTLNSKASRILGRNQYAVPVTIEEFMSLTPANYDQLCSAQRLVPLCRKESNEILAMLTAIEQSGDFDDDGVTASPTYSVKDPERLEAYMNECTREILSDDDFDKLSIRPCFKKVHQERISLGCGNGHKMRIGAVMELARQKLSIDSINRWFSFCDDYDPNITEKAIIDLISRGYTDKHLDEYGSEYRKGMRCETIQHCGFCLTEKCSLYQRKLERR